MQVRQTGSLRESLVQEVPGGVKDREMTHCMVRIRLATGLELSREDSEKLAQSYFKRRGNNEQDTLEEAE